MAVKNYVIPEQGGSHTNLSFSNLSFVVEVKEQVKVRGEGCLDVQHFVQYKIDVIISGRGSDLTFKFKFKEQVRGEGGKLETHTVHVFTYLDIVQSSAGGVEFKFSTIENYVGGGVII